MPPFVGGLHCGVEGHCSTTFGLALVVPPSVGGLHCGVDEADKRKDPTTSCRPSWAALAAVVPADSNAAVAGGPVPQGKICRRVPSDAPDRDVAIIGVSLR